MLTGRARKRRLTSIGNRALIMPSGCVLWTGYVHSNGYAYYRTDEGNVLVHRMVYELLVGPIPPGHHLHHAETCESTACVNPAHLTVLTPSEHWAIGNSPSARRARATHCQNGHEFTPANTWISKRGHRRCRRCHADNELARRRGS